MLKKISLKKLVQIAEGSKGISLTMRSTSIVKGIKIVKTCLRDEVPDITPTQKGKLAATPPKEVKRKATWNFKKTTTAALREGTSANPGILLGPKASLLGSPSMAKKILEGVIPLSNKENVDKLTLNQVVTKFFHVID